MTPTGYSEDALIERPAIALLSELSWEAVNAYHKFAYTKIPLEKEKP